MKLSFFLLILGVILFGVGMAIATVNLLGFVFTIPGGMLVGIAYGMAEDGK